MLGKQVAEYSGATIRKEDDGVEIPWVEKREQFTTASAGRQNPCARNRNDSVNSRLA